MRIFIDSANLADIEEALRTGVVSGVTTNPTILANDGVSDRLERYLRIRDLLMRYGRELSLSVELVASETDAMLDEAFALDGAVKYPHLAIKLPMRWSWLPVVRKLNLYQIKVNVTACMSYAQAVVAADAGTTFVSLFWCRIRDYGARPADVVRDVRTTFRENDCPTRIIVGSIRAHQDVTNAIMAGADIVTVPPRFLPELCAHPKTDEAINQFMRDAGALVTTT